jgi:ATP-dependent DNA helicase RecQ
LLRHFGESPPDQCGNCDNCQSPPAFSDATELARKLLSAVYRTGQSYGLGHIERVLTGRADDRVVQQQHDRLSVYGIATADEAALIKPVSRALLVRDALRTTDHGGLMLGPDARAILKGEASVEIALAPRRTSRKQTRGRDHPPDPIFDALRACRRDLAQAAGVPPYVIFHDATLREMAQIRPRSLRDMALVSGVGDRKLDAYGDAFLAVLKQY